MRHYNTTMVAFSYLLVVACAHTSPDRAGSASAPGERAEASQGDAVAVVRADEELFGALDVLHEQAIAHADLIKKRARTEKLKGFAVMMSADHQRLSHREHALRDALELHARDGEASRDLARTSTLRLDIESDLKGNALDRNLVEVQIKLHADWLAVLDDKMIPDAHTQELQDELADARAVVAEYYERALTLRAAMTPGA